jgi:hypothetical protein
MDDSHKEAIPIGVSVLFTICENNCGLDSSHLTANLRSLGADMGWYWTSAQCSVAEDHGCFGRM